MSCLFSLRAGVDVSLSIVQAIYARISVHAVGRFTVEVRGNGTVAGPVVEDSPTVLEVLEAGLLAWANDWVATVLPGDRVTLDTAGTT